MTSLEPFRRRAKSVIEKVWQNLLWHGQGNIKIFVKILSTHFVQEVRGKCFLIEKPVVWRNKSAWWSRVWKQVFATQAQKSETRTFGECNTRGQREVMKQHFPISSECHTEGRRQVLRFSSIMWMPHRRTKERVWILYHQTCLALSAKARPKDQGKEYEIFITRRTCTFSKSQAKGPWEVVRYFLVEIWRRIAKRRISCRP